MVFKKQLCHKILCVQAKNPHPHLLGMHVSNGRMAEIIPVLALQGKNSWECQFSMWGKQPFDSKRTVTFASRLLFFFPNVPSIMVILVL